MHDPIWLQSEILAQISDAIVVLDADERILFRNSAADRIAGLVGQDVLRRDPADGEKLFWLDPEERQAAASALSGEGIWHGENERVTRSGERLCLDSTVRAMKDARGVRAGTVAIIRDTTERTREREEYRLIKRRLEEALKVGGMGYLEWDLATNEMIWSEETFRMYGFEPNAFSPTIDLTVQMVHPDDKEYVRNHLNAVIRGESEYSIEHRMVRPDGQIIYVHAQGEVTRDAKGNPLRMLGTVIEITERKRAEEEQRRSHELLQKIVASLEESVLLVDEDTRMILECNETAERMFGYRRDEFLGQTTRLIHVDEEKFHEFLQEMFVSIKSVGYYRIQFPAKRRSGEVFPAEFFIRPIRSGSGSNLAVGVVRDLSERIRSEEERSKLEAQLQQARKMEAIGQLAGGVAHDFNNMLTVINGYASVTLGRLSPSDPLHQDISEILLAGQRATELTQQLLAFSRKQIVRPRPMDLRHAVAEDEKMLRRLIGENIQLSVSLDPGPVCIFADPGQIQQVIINLVVNARDAMPEGGMITVETGNVVLGRDEAEDLGLVKPGPHGVLTVTDSGVGMDAETKSRIFEPFFTTKELGRGAGLGLSTVYGIVRQSNGSILVESQPDKGTTFKVYLPSAEGPVESSQEEEIRPDALRGSETILLVEDEREVRKLTAASLKRFGYKLLEAANAGEAFLLCEQVSEPIALMITDVVMPGMTGWQLAQRLQKLRPQMKVIYMSGYADDVLTNRGALQDGLHFLQKPFDPDRLAAKVREILGRPQQTGGL